MDKLWIKTCFFLLTFGKALENEMRDMRWLWILLLHSLLKKMWKNRKCHIFTDEMCGILACILFFEMWKVGGKEWGILWKNKDARVVLSPW